MGSADRSLDEAYSSVKMYYPVSSLAHDAQHSKISTYQRIVQNAPFSSGPGTDADKGISSIWLTRYFEKRRYLMFWGFINLLEMLSNYYTQFTQIRAQSYTAVLFNIVLFMIPRVYTAFLLIGGVRDWQMNPWVTGLFLSDQYPFVELYSLLTVPSTMQEATVLLNPCFVHPTVVVQRAALGCIPRLMYQCVSFLYIVDTQSHGFVFPILLTQDNIAFISVLFNLLGLALDALRLSLFTLIFAPSVLYSLIAGSAIPDLSFQLRPVLASMASNMDGVSQLCISYVKYIVYLFEVVRAYGEQLPLHYIPSILCCVITISVTFTYVESNALINSPSNMNAIISTGSSLLYMPSKVSVLMALRFVHVLLRTFCVGIFFYSVMMFEYHIAFTSQINTTIARAQNYVPFVSVTTTHAFSQVDISISPLFQLVIAIVLYLRYVNEFILTQAKTQPQDTKLTKPDGEPVPTHSLPLGIARTPISTPRIGPASTPRFIPSTPLHSNLATPSTPLRSPFTPSSTMLDRTASTPRIGRTFSFSQSQTRPASIVTVAPYKDSVEQASLTTVAKLLGVFMFLDKRVSLHTVSLTKRISTFFPVNVRALPPPSYSVFKSNLTVHKWYLWHLADNVMLMCLSAFFIVLQKTLEATPSSQAPLMTIPGFSWGIATKNVHWMYREFQYNHVSFLPSAMLLFVEKLLTDSIATFYAQFTHTLAVFTRPLVCEMEPTTGLVSYFASSYHYTSCHVQSVFYGFSRMGRISFLFIAVVLGFVVLFTCLPVVLAYVYPEGSLLRRIPGMLYRRKIPQTSLSSNSASIIGSAYTSSFAAPTSVPSTPRGNSQHGGSDLYSSHADRVPMTPTSLSRSNSTANQSPSQSGFLQPILQGNTFSTSEDGVYSEVVAQKALNNPRLYVPRKQVDISAYLPPGEQNIKPTGRTPSVLPPNPYSVDFLPAHPTLQTRGYQRTLFSTSSLSPFRTAKATRAAKLNASTTITPPMKKSTWYGVPVLDKDGILLDTVPSNADTTETFLLKSKMQTAVHTSQSSNEDIGSASRKRIASMLEEELLTPKKPKFDLVRLPMQDIRSSSSRSNSPDYRLVNANAVGLIDVREHVAPIGVQVHHALDAMTDSEAMRAREVMKDAEEALPRWNPLHDALGVVNVDYVAQETVTSDFVPNIEGNGAYIDPFESTTTVSVGDSSRRVIHTVATDTSMKDL